MVMSALPPKADVCSATAHVCYGPKADIAPPDG
jgi:CheY-like chemotaxis protein